MDDPPGNPFLELLLLPGSVYPIVVGTILFLILVSAIISASESAFFSLQSKDLDSGRRSKSRRDKALVALMNNPYWLLRILLLTNLFVKVAIVAAVVLVWNASNTPLTIRAMVLATTITLVIVSELLPKLFGRQHNIRLARRMAIGWEAVINMSKPTLNFLSKRRDKDSLDGDQRKTKFDSLSQAIELAAGIYGPSDSEKEILKGIANFGTLRVRQVMRTRTEISAINLNSSFTELMDYVTKSGFSRIPVFDGTIDKITGVLYIKDLLPFLEEQVGFEWRSLVRPGFFVPETKKIDLLLNDFQEKRVHMAIVIGEAGGTSGLVTLEDLIEEIIGEINDEFDEVDDQIRKIDQKTFVFDGKTLLYDFCKALDIDPNTFSKLKRESESLGALVHELSKKVPHYGNQIKYEQFTFVIESEDSNRIKKIRVKIHEQA